MLRVCVSMCVCVCLYRRIYITYVDLRLANISFEKAATAECAVTIRTNTVYRAEEREREREGGGG